MNTSSDKHLHIVSFNVPYPADYGGVIDVFYKIKALHVLGIKVHLHCYYYGREEAKELEDLCASVNYYPRKKFYQAIYSNVPYIIGSRQSGELLDTLSADAYPVLFEGLHTCFYLSHPALKNKLKAVRMHNVEWDYYRSLKEQERNYLLKFYYSFESNKLKKYEEELKFADKIFTISKSDYEYFRQFYENITYVPAFHSNEQVTSQPGKGDYVLYHANLSVVENHQGAMFILKKIAADSQVPFIIAGKNPLADLKKEVKKYPNVQLIINPPFEQMSKLIADAHINLLPTFQSTGIKLKLLNSLYRGRFCIVNPPMINNTGLEELCKVEVNPNVIRRMIDELLKEDFTQAEIDRRKDILENQFSNRVNAEKIVAELF